MGAYNIVHKSFLTLFASKLFLNWSITIHEQDQLAHSYSTWPRRINLVSGGQRDKLNNRKGNRIPKNFPSDWAFLYICTPTTWKSHEVLLHSLKKKKIKKINHKTTRRGTEKGQSKCRMFLHKERLHKLVVFCLEKDMTKGGTWQTNMTTNSWVEWRRGLVRSYWLPLQI